MSSTISALRALLALDNSDYLDGLASSKTAADDFGTKLSKVGGAVVVGALSAAGTAIVGVGAAAWDAGNTVDGAMDQIATATGASGPQLAALRSDFDAVFKSVPTDAATAAEAIGILNSRLDLTGPALQNIATPLLEATRLLGGDITANAEGFTRVIGDWSIPTEQASSSLDTLFLAAQKTGVPLDGLMQRIVQYGAPMRNFGFSFEDSAAMLAKWEAEGVNVETVMGGMRIAQGKFINSGVDMTTGLWETIDAIKNASTETEGLAIASDVFGAKAAGDMFDTIRSGKFDIDELVGAMQNADGAIMDTAASTADWGEKWTKFKNQIIVALAPIGGTMMDGVGKAMDAVVEIFNRPDVQAGLASFVTMIGSFITQAVTYIPVLIDGFMQFVTFLQNNQGIVAGVLAALGVAVTAWAVTTAAAAWTAMVPFLPVIAVIALVGAAVYLLYEAWKNNWGGIRDTLTGIWASLQPVFTAIKEWLGVAIPAALQILKLWWDATVANLQMMWTAIQPVLQVLGALGNLVGAVLELAFRALAGVLQNVIIPAFQKVWSWVVEKLMPALQPFGDWLRTKLGPAFKGVGDAISKVVEWIGKMADKVRNVELPAWMTPGSPTPWEIGLRGVSDAMQTLSRSHLPTFTAALKLQAEPITASANIGANTVAPSVVPAGSMRSDQGDENKNANITIHITNPKREAAEDDVRKTLKNLSFMGVLK